MAPISDFGVFPDVNAAGRVDGVRAAPPVTPLILFLEVFTRKLFSKEEPRRGFVCIETIADFGVSSGVNAACRVDGVRFWTPIHSY